jgi:hypothetical protein
LIGRSLVACAVSVLGLGSCQLIAGIGDLELSGAAGGSGAAGVAASSAGAAGEAVGAAPSFSSTAVEVGEVIAPSGQAQQTKLIYASESRRWWLFYLDAAASSSLRTKYSSDFVEWKDGASLQLAAPHGADGRNVSVAYRDVEGHDVVHLVIGQRLGAGDRRLYHARATINGAVIEFEQPQERSLVVALSPSLDPDGPVTSIGSDGHVVDLTSWVEHDGVTGDMYAIRSVSPDTGANWDGAWQDHVALEIVPFAINAHGVANMKDGQVLALWEDAVAEGRATNLRWSLGGAGPWSGPPAPVFTSPYQQSANDWAVLALTPSDVHAVRRVASGDTYEHRRFDGLGWRDGQAIPALPGKAGYGVFLAADGAEVGLFSIADDAANSVQAIRWRGDAWGSWAPVVTSAAARTYLSGCSTALDHQVGLVWTEPGKSGLRLVAALVGF